MEEEDIKILEEFIEAYKTAEEVLDGDVIHAIEGLIARNKELEEEKFNNERTIELFKKGYSKIYKELNINSYAMNENVLINEIKTNFIPKSKVREKIEEIENTGIDVAWEQINYTIREQDRAKIQVLQELLEEES